jgi:hypothetical protein
MFLGWRKLPHSGQNLVLRFLDLFRLVAYALLKCGLFLLVFVRIDLAGE